MIVSQISQGNLCGDDLIVGDPLGATPGTTAVIPVALAGTQLITGFQFDLVYASGQAQAGLAAVVQTTKDHKVDSREVAPGRTRIVVYSPTNSVLDDSTVLNLPLALTAVSPAGGPDLTVQNLIFVNAGGTAVPPLVAYGQLIGWRKQKFTASERLDPAIIGDDRDPDGDRLTNLVEYALGAEPKSNNPGPAPTASQTTDAQNKQWLSLKFNQAKNATGVSLAVEATSDLEHWTQNVPYTATGTGTATTLELEARVEVTPGRKFLHLKVSRTGNP